MEFHCIYVNRLLALYSLVSMDMFAYDMYDASYRQIKHQQLNEHRLVPYRQYVHQQRNKHKPEIWMMESSAMLTSFRRCIIFYTDEWEVKHHAFNTTSHIIGDVHDRYIYEFVCRCGRELWVSGNLSTTAIVLSKSILLKCFYSDRECTKNDIKSWYVGQMCTPLCSNGRCENRNKYKMDINHIDKTFNLEIYNVNDMDLKEPYICTCWINSHTQHINLPVRWSAKSETDTIMLRETHSLVCEYHSDVACPSNADKIWRYTNTDEMLCGNGTCFNEKYKMTFNNNKKNDGNAKISILEIKNFTEEDVREYTCSCKFVSFTKSLEVTNYINMPENFRSSALYRDNQVIITIFAEKVFPILKCNETMFESLSKCHSSLFCNAHSSHEKKCIQQDMKVERSYGTALSNFTFYNVQGELKVDTNGITCSNISLEVKCFVGNQPFPVTVSTEIRCNAFETIGQYIGLPALVFVNTLIIVLLLCTCVKIRRRLKKLFGQIFGFVLKYKK